MGKSTYCVKAASSQMHSDSYVKLKVVPKENENIQRNDSVIIICI